MAPATAATLPQPLKIPSAILTFTTSRASVLEPRSILAAAIRGQGSALAPVVNRGPCLPRSFCLWTLRRTGGSVVAVTSGTGPIAVATERVAFLVHARNSLRWPTDTYARIGQRAQAKPA